MGKRIFIVVFSLAVASVPSFATNAILGFQVGYSMPNSSSWHPGFSLCGNAFLAITPNIAFGGIVAYNRWAPDGDSLLRYNYYPGGLRSLTVSSTSGGLNNIEIMPAARFYLPVGEKKNMGIVIYPQFAFLLQEDKPTNYFCIKAGLSFTLPLK